MYLVKQYHTHYIYNDVFSGATSYPIIINVNRIIAVHHIISETIELILHYNRNSLTRPSVVVVVVVVFNLGVEAAWWWWWW